MQLLWPAVTVAIAARALHLRRRVQALRVLRPDGDEGPAPPGYRLLTAEGVEVDDTALRAATHHARARGLDVLDLIPGDLPAERLVDLLRWVSPATYAGRPMATGHGAAQAMLVTDDVIRRVGITRWDALGLTEMDHLAAAAKRHAPWTTDLALVPWLRSSPDVSSQRWARQRRHYRGATGNVLAARAIGLATLARALVGRRPGAFAALAAYQARTLIATAGTAATPRDTVAQAVAGSVDAVRDVATSVAAGVPELTRPDAGIDAARAAYRPMLEAATAGRYVEPRRDDCPICDSSDLTVEIHVPDAFQGKPGHFTMERCGRCDTVFQNPRLTVEGLGFYYRDFYDGVSAEHADMMFGAEAGAYTGRIALVGRHVEPNRWLDVGTGHGHLCLAARDRWPDAEIEGLDMTESIDEAARRGWVTRGYRGAFPTLAPDLADRYDVVSMHHYLEHTRDPVADLDAVATVLEKGGHLEIEVPNPDAAFGRRLGGAWVAYFQPQHQHMLPVRTLRHLLSERGFTTVEVETAAAHQPVDLLFAVTMALARALPAGDVPWAPAPPGVPRRLARNLGMTAMAPVAGLAAAVDRVAAPVVRRRWPNTYRIIARYDGP